MSNLNVRGLTHPPVTPIAGHNARPRPHNRRLERLPGSSAPRGRDPRRRVPEPWAGGPHEFDPLAGSSLSCRSVHVLAVACAVGRHPTPTAAVPGRATATRTCPWDGRAAPPAENGSGLDIRPFKTMCTGGSEEFRGWASRRPPQTGHPTCQLRRLVRESPRRDGRDRPCDQVPHLRGVAAAHPAEQIRRRHYKLIEPRFRVAGVFAPGLHQ